LISISKRNKKNGETVWQVTVRVRGAKSISSTFEDRKTAVDYGSEVEKGLLAQMLVPASPPKTPAEIEADFKSEELGGLVAMFAKSKRARLRHAGVAPTVIRSVGSDKVSNICNSWVEAYVDRMRKTLSKRGRPFSYNSISSQLVLISLAVRWRARTLDLTPPSFPSHTHMIPIGTDEPRERRLEPEEERLLFQWLESLPPPADKFWSLLVRLAIETAARLQELVFAEWKEFTLQEDRAWWTIPALHTKCKKTRTVPLGKEARRIMRELATMRDAASPRVFHFFDSPRCVSQKFAAYIEATGIKGFRFHDLRHEGISRMMLGQAKMTPYHVMRAVGHSSLDMLNRYANLRGGELAELVD
jgi:integrase